MHDTFPINQFAVEKLPIVLRSASESVIARPSNEPFSQTDLQDVRRTEEAKRVAFFDAISLSEALAIYNVVRSLRPQRSVEVGFCCGGSGLAIMQALEDEDCGEHHAVDPFQTSYARNQGRVNVAAAGLSHRLTLHEHFPEEVVHRIGRVQFAFIDASHLFDLSILDFALVDKILDAGGIVGFHDMWMPSLQKVVRFILRNRSYELVGAFWDARRSWRSHLRESVLRSWSSIALPFRGILSEEIIDPWWCYRLSNIAFLRKNSDDQRDWRDFHLF